MQCDDRRAQANRENAKKSTGPRTEAGKARSRANAFKHGLAGEGVAFPGEVEGELRRFVERQVAAEVVAPRDDREQMLVEKIARITWMLDRAERAEEAQAIIRASRAEAVEEERRDAEVARFADMIESEPHRAVQGLLRSKGGCRWVANALHEMMDALDADWWVASLDRRLDALCAPAQSGRLRISRAKALALALGSAKHQAIWPNGIPGLEDVPQNVPREVYSEWSRRRAEIVLAERPRWRAELKAILARRLAEVERRVEELEARPDPGIDLAAVASSFDLGEQPERLRRFIRSRERERRHLIAELELHRDRRDRQANQAEPDETPEPQPEAPPEPPAPLTPFEPPPDAALDVDGHGLNDRADGEKWVRPGSVDAGNPLLEFDEEEPGARPWG